VIPQPCQIANYWEPSKKLLNDPTKFLDSLLTYDKDNISDGIIKRVEPYIQVGAEPMMKWEV
jgi:dynein heavy chain